MKQRQLIQSIDRSIKEVENSRQAIIQNSEELTIDEQRVLFKVNGYLKRIQKELYDYQIEKIKC